MNNSKNTNLLVWHLKKVVRCKRHFHPETKRDVLKPYYAPEIVIDEQHSIIANPNDESTRPRFRNEKLLCIKIEHPDCSSSGSESEEGKKTSTKRKKSTSTKTAEKRKRTFIHDSTKKTKGIHVCHICQKDFNTLQELSNHSATHLEAEFKCTICGRVRKSQKSFENHMRFHREGFKTCDPCGKQFKESGQLNNHKKVKNQQHMYACTKCELQTLLYSWYHEHVQYGHRDKKEVLCDFCDKTFQLPTEMKAHQKSVHGGVRPSV